MNNEKQSKAKKKAEHIDSNEKRFNSNYFGTLEAVVTFDMDRKRDFSTNQNVKRNK